MDSLRPLLACLAVTAFATAGPVDFNRDIRPLLNKQCSSCHGGVKQAGGVSFLYRNDVLGKGDSGKPVAVPGDPDASEMIRRIRTGDPDDRMPPPDHHPEPLSDHDVDLLTRWIEQGAEWGEHWAFQAPKNWPLPAVADPAWPRQDLDRFILARLDAEALKPSPAAAAAAWLRRVSLDLTGLPPTLAELEEFLQATRHNPQADDGPDIPARAAAVDRLLASPAYGERWASVWLDLARYADTYGFEKDPHRNIWPWRDWVIRAFNANMPFDEFTIKQLAGDLLPNPGPDDFLATGFHRNTQNNTEGGTDDEEYRLAAVIDRVNTTWTAWNATTFGCVQCHAHPYDPIPHEDYYSFMAFFNNTEDVDLNHDFPRTKATEKREQQADAVRLEREIRSSREAINDAALDAVRTINDWQALDLTDARVEPPTGKLTQQPNGDILTSGTTPSRAVFVLTAPASPLAVIRIEILPQNDDPQQWGGRGTVISGFEAAYLDTQGERRPIPLREVVADFLAGPFDPADSLKKNAGGFGDYPMLKGPRTAWFVTELPNAPIAGESLELRIRHGATCNESQNTVLQRFRIATSADPAATSFSATPQRAEAWKALAQLRKQYNAIPGTLVPTLVERGNAARRDTRLFIRGNRSTRGKSVSSRIPELFDASANSSPPPDSRLAMARWLVGPDNPLAARVLANRLWAELFGTGIVETLEDFGSSGTQPSHPALLDFLAQRLRNRHGWQIKPILKELVLSATYAQSATASPAAIERDPRNRLLARGPRQRLSAEMVRDQALLVSGLLSTKQFGPPVYPPQPDGVWKTVYSGAKWATSEGDDRFRRAIYTYTKRTSGYPPFLSFDAPSRDVCSARRIPTNTPLQALVTLNDPAQIEFAQALAQRMADAGTDLATRLSHGYRLLTLRQPSSQVLGTLSRLHADTLAEYDRLPEESKQLAASPDQAALVLVANTLLNCDVALTR